MIGLAQSPQSSTDKREYYKQGKNKTSVWLLHIQFDHVTWLQGQETEVPTEKKKQNEIFIEDTVCFQLDTYYTWRLNICLSFQKVD